MAFFGFLDEHWEELKKFFANLYKTIKDLLAKANGGDNNEGENN